jgi:bifunctional UDP-N-acetylglucosamine pyrophosphorylase/glucosamine-1-phosphate N-acetyltransferase
VKIVPVILAAGKGTRMKSELPKLLHPIGGKPLIHHALDLALQLTAEKPIVVVGHQAKRVEAAVGERGHCVLQAEQLGTGHAVQQCQPVLEGKADLIVVWAADMPLLTVETLNQLITTQRHGRSPFTMLTVTAQDPRGFGRIVRDTTQQIIEIVEEADASPAQLAIRELNAGVYCFRAEWLWQNLANIPLSEKGEYYLTDLVAIAVHKKQRIASISVQTEAEAIGVNNRVQLAEAESHLRERINRYWQMEGVTIIDPASTYIDATVSIGNDTIILPNTHLQGNTRIGSHCRIGPNSILSNAHVSNRCKIFASVLEDARVEDNVQIGPFGHLRHGAHLAEGVYMGNFGEVKNSYLAPGVKLGHFSYIGDSTIGENTNIGAGTITCNFGADKKKHRTSIGANAYIGSDTLLIAPVSVGDQAMTGAGSIVTKNIPADSLAVGAPARVIRKSTPPNQ